VSVNCLWREGGSSFPDAFGCCQFGSGLLTAADIGGIADLFWPGHFLIPCLRSRI